MDFAEVVTVEDARSVDLDPIDADATTTVVVRPAGPWGFERFLFENRRRREGAVVDGDLPGSGVLAYRTRFTRRESGRAERLSRVVAGPTAAMTSETT